MDIPRCPSIENSHSAKNTVTARIRSVMHRFKVCAVDGLALHGRSMVRIRLWQWPNLLALDAALIALVWQAAFAGRTGA